MPLLNRKKRDVGVKGGSVKTVETNGDSGTTKSMHVVTTRKIAMNSGTTKSAGSSGLKGNYRTSFSQTESSKDTNLSQTNLPNPDIDPFAIKGVSSGSETANTLFSRSPELSQLPQTLQNGGEKITFHRGPNGEKVTTRTRTVRKYVITRMPTKTVRKIVIRRRPLGAAANLMHGGSNRFTTKTVKISFSRGPTLKTGGLMAGGQSAVTTKTTAVQTTATGRRNPIASIVHTIQQQRVSGGNNVGAESTKTKTISAVAVTKSVQPSLSVVKVTKQTVTPPTETSLGSSNTATLKGLEVEVPGYTAGLRHQWKWVLARRVGVYPPYVQVLDPEVLFYKLGLQRPNLPSLPEPVHNILNRIPVHPVGSDINGFLLSSRILERIRGFTERLNGITKLRNMLSTSDTPNQDNSNILKSILTGTESSPSSPGFLQKLLLASLSGSGKNPLNSPYPSYLASSDGGLFGRPNPGQYGSPWAPLLNGQFSGSQWPFYNALHSQIRRFGQNRPLDSSDNTRSSSGEPFLFPEDEKFVPSVETPAYESPEALSGSSSYVKSLLESITGSRHGQPLEESPLRASDKLARVLGESKLRYLLKGRNGRSSIIRLINKALHRGDYHNVLTLVRHLGIRPHTRVYNNIVQEILFSGKHRNAGSDYPQDLVSALRELSRTGNDDSLGYLSTLRSSLPRLVEPYKSGPVGTHESSNELITLLKNMRRRDLATEESPITEILLNENHRRHPTQSRNTFDTSRRQEAIETLLEYARREPSPQKRSELTKQITKALLRSAEHPVSNHGTKAGQLAKLVSIHSDTHTDARPQGLTESRVFSTAYQMSKAVAPAPTPIFSAPASILEGTRPITQQSQPMAMLGINGFSAATSGQPLLQPYAQFVPQTYFPNGGSTAPDQSTLMNRQFIASTNNIYGSPQRQSATTMLTGTGGYSGYATVPTSTAYMSQYATQPYYLGTSLYGGHPHYVVEGHEAPGTRWQLRVWRHHPGVSYVAPGFSGFQSSNLGSVVTRARETVSRGLQLGGQPSHFGFAAYGSGLVGGNLIGGSSQYVVKAPDGSLVLSRQPLQYRPLTQGSPSSGVVVSETKTTTKTTSGTTLPSVSSPLSGHSLQSDIEGGSSAGTTKSASFSEMTQTNDSSLLNSLASSSDSQSKESLFSSGGAGSSSVQADSELSQSKLRR